MSANTEDEEVDNYMMTFRQFMEAAKIQNVRQSNAADSKRGFFGGWVKCNPRTLVRALGIPSDRKRTHDGPAPGGIFYALADGNDLYGYGPYIHADTLHLLRTGDLYMKDVRKTVGWVKVNNVSDIDFEVSTSSDYDSGSLVMDVRPFLPEFYYVPRNAKGRRVFRRAGGKRV